MRTSGLPALLFVAVGVSVAAEPRRDVPPGPAARAGQPPPVAADEVAPTPLRAVTSARFSDDNWIAYRSAQCDADGNVFLFLVPAADPRDVRNAPAPPRYTKQPSEILRVSADGKKKTTFYAATARVFADAGRVHTITTALDAGGTLYALVWVGENSEKGHQYIVSFDDKGRYDSAVEVDHEEMIVFQIDVFGSGDFLLRGVRTRPSGFARAAVMPSGGGALRDVVGLPIEALNDPAEISKSDHLTRGGDGRLYVVPGGDDALYAIDQTGDAELVLHLVPAPKNQRLTRLRAAGPRVAAAYFEPLPGSGRMWIDVYDLVSHERTARYGPLAGEPLCYRSDGSRDEFTIIGDAHSLVTLAP